MAEKVGKIFEIFFYIGSWPYDSLIVWYLSFIAMNTLISIRIQSDRMHILMHLKSELGYIVLHKDAVLPGNYAN